LQYSETHNEALYWRPSGLLHPFRSSVRLVLIDKMIKEGFVDIFPDDEREGVDDTDYRGTRVRDQILSGDVLGFFPLRDYVVSSKLLKVHLQVRSSSSSSSFSFPTSSVRFT
jgi:hypothetical protein